MFPSNYPLHDNITIAGFPYHGIVMQGTLTTDYGLTFDHVQPSDGLIAIQRNPIAAAVSRSVAQQEFDLVHNFEWVDYLVFAGQERILAGQEFGSNRWIYADESNRGWIIRVEITDNTTTCDIDVYLDSAFMLVDRPARALSMSSINRLLASETYSVGTGGLELNFTVDELITTDNGLEHNENGSSAILNIYQFVTSPSSGTFKFKGTTTELGAAIKIDMSGSGAMIEDAGSGVSYGDGITATLSVHADHTTVYSTDSGYLTTGSAVYPDSLTLVSSVSATSETLDANVPCGVNYGSCYACELINDDRYTYSWDTDDIDGSQTVWDDIVIIIRYVYDDAGLPFAVKIIDGDWEYTERTAQAATGFTESFTEYYWDEYCNFLGTDGGTRTWEPECYGRNDKWVYRVQGVRLLMPGGRLDIGVIEDVRTYKENSGTPFTAGAAFGLGSTQTLSDNSGGSSYSRSNVNLLDGHTCNCPTAALPTNVIHTSGATYSSASTEYVSYHPERGEWAINATYPVSWA